MLQLLHHFAPKFHLLHGDFAALIMYWNVARLHAILAMSPIKELDFWVKVVPELKQVMQWYCLQSLVL